MSLPVAPASPSTIRVALRCSSADVWALSRPPLQETNHTLKRALTDPHLFSGIGNAYSDEILHSARLSPFKQTSSLTDEEVQRLYEATRQTLTQWIATAYRRKLVMSFRKR